MVSESVVTGALLDLSRAARLVGVPWALVGGQALALYGVPRETLDADAFVPQAGIEELADLLVGTFGWTPVVYDDRTGDYEDASDVTVHFMQDPVLFDVGEERWLIPLRSPLGLPVELLAAQHPVEQEMVETAVPKRHGGVAVPVAPLGGVLLVKAKADRPKDVAAIEQAAEHLPAAQLRDAVAWATERDEATAKDLRAILQAARTRRAPVGTRPYRRKR